jgi:hypothetical protein
MTMREATNHSTSPQRLSELSKSRQVIVRRGVARNPSTPLETLLEMAFSDDTLTCANVFKNESSNDIIRTACMLNNPNGVREKLENNDE